MSSKTTLVSPLTDVATVIKERRCDLIGRQKELRNKISTMERSIPILMAYKMWMTDDNCHNTPFYCKVQEIMKLFSPLPGPADKLLDRLKNTVNNLHQETAQLHDKIINVDVELEEAGMELESLEFANKELEQNLTELQHEIQRHKTLSLHSIHSEDLICLKKIRQLAQEELKLKTYIKELGNKEDMYKRQINKMLSCKELQRDNKMTTECMQKFESGSKELQCPLDVYNKHNMTKQTYAFKDKKQICCSYTTSTDCKETSKRTKVRKKLYSCCVPLVVHASCTAMNKSRACELCCKYCRQISSATLKSKSPCSINPLSEFPLSVASDVLQLSKQVIQSSVSCELDKTCTECEIATACKHINSYKCNCARKLSTLPCDYSVVSLSKTYQSTELDNNNSDEEFCECCSCGYESSENLL